MLLEYGGLAEQRLRLGEEVRHRLDLVLRAEHELFRPFGHLEQQVHARVAREILDEERKIADDARRPRARSRSCAAAGRAPRAADAPTRRGPRLPSPAAAARPSRPPPCRSVRPRASLPRRRASSARGDDPTAPAPRATEPTPT